MNKKNIINQEIHSKNLERYKHLVKDMKQLIEKFKKNQESFCNNCVNNKLCSQDASRLEIFKDLIDNLTSCFKVNPLFPFEYQNLIEAGVSIVIQVSNTGSMSPKIQYGDLLIIKKGDEPKKGDISAYIMDNVIKIHFFKKFKNKKKVMVFETINGDTEETIIKNYIGKVKVIKSGTKLCKEFIN